MFPSRPHGRLALALVILSVSLIAMLCAFATSAAAMSLRQAERAFPGIVPSAEEAEPILPVPFAVTDLDSPPNAIVAADGSGFYALSPDGGLRDPETGEAIYGAPTLAVSGNALVPRTGGALDDVRLPRGTADWLHLGDGIRVRLSGRANPRVALRAGAALYSGALRGVDQLVTLDGHSGAVEEWLLVNKASGRVSFRYDLVIPRGFTAKQRGKKIEIRNRNRDVVLMITAPMALDAAKRRHPVKLKLDAARRSFTVLVAPKRGKTIVWPLAVDPLYLKTINQTAYPADPGVDADEQFPYYLAELCGARGQNEPIDIPGNGALLPHEWVMRRPVRAVVGRVLTA